MVKRTEEEIISKAPVQVIIGGEPLDMAPLVIAESRKWRQQFSKLLGELPALSTIDTENPENFKKGMNTLMVAMPDKVLNLVCQYMKLKPEEIENKATDQEISEAFEVAVELAFPLVTSLGRAVEKISH